MKKTILSATVLIAALTSCMDKKEETAPKPVIEKPKPEISVKRGEYLVSIMGCDDCHSPKKMGPMGPEIIEELRLSGYPSDRALQPIGSKGVLDKGWALLNYDLTSAVGPWGQSFAANLTSDGTGIGNWTIENFTTAIRKGKYKGLDASRNLLPPMPWFAYKNLTDEDLGSIFAFLQSTKPVNNVVPAPIAPGDIK